MKILVRFGLMLFLLVGGAAQAHDHGDHVKHNMVMYGEPEIFLSHIVYKLPHNFQVILKARFSEQIKELYLKERKAHPTDEFIYLADEMKIREIDSMPEISGTISRTDSEGTKTILATKVPLLRKDFDIIFFNELPLSLDNTKTF